MERQDIEKILKEGSSLDVLSNNDDRKTILREIQKSLRTTFSSEGRYLIEPRQRVDGPKFRDISTLYEILSDGIVDSRRGEPTEDKFIAFQRRLGISAPTRASLELEPTWFAVRSAVVSARELADKQKFAEAQKKLQEAEVALEGFDRICSYGNYATVLCFEKKLEADENVSRARAYIENLAERRAYELFRDVCATETWKTTPKVALSFIDEVKKSLKELEGLVDVLHYTRQMDSIRDPFAKKVELDRRKKDELNKKIDDARARLHRIERSIGEQSTLKGKLTSNCASLRREMAKNAAEKTQLLKKIQNLPKPHRGLFALLGWSSKVSEAEAGRKKMYSNISQIEYRYAEIQKTLLDLDKGVAEIDLTLNGLYEERDDMFSLLERLEKDLKGMN